MNVQQQLRHSVLALSIALALPVTGNAADVAVDERPSPWAMVGDLLVARPIGAAMTAAGTAVWVVSLPFTLAAGHAGEAAETLVVGPAEETFVRCLGCRNNGYTGKDVAASNAPDEDD